MYLTLISCIHVHTPVVEVTTNEPSYSVPEDVGQLDVWINITNGQLELTSAPGVAITTFTQDDVDNNLVIFIHDGTDTLVGSFDVSLADGGEDGAAAALGTVTIGINPVDDAPTLDTNAGGTVAEAGTLSITTTERNNYRIVK